MKFVLLDRIVLLEPGRRIVARKALSLAAEYLADHFPSFPVMPGVLMLQAMAEAGGWLLQATHDFGYSVLELAEAKNVSYKNFVRPGQVLEIEVRARKIGTDTSEFDGVGRCEDQEMVAGRFVLRHGRIDRDNERLATLHERIVSDAKSRFELLAAEQLITQGIGG